MVGTNLPEPSEEQNEILFNFKKGYNIKIEAVAGSGKTTMLLMIAKLAVECFGKKSLILTYNKTLQEEIKIKTKNCQLEDYVSIYTYHGYASRIYESNIYNDKLLREKLVEEEKFKCHPEIILLDEVQDMNSDYHRLVEKIMMNDEKNEPKRIVLVGDRRQCINDYLGASCEFMINYEKMFKNGRKWKELKLRTSYRLTPAICEFVNSNILSEDIIKPGNKINKNKKPIYHVGVWNIDNIVRKNVEKYGPNNVVIMMPSVKHINPKSPVGKLLTSKNNILFSVSSSDETINEKTLQNKVLVTSFNSMKGIERLCTIIINFDESYFEFYNKIWRDENEISLPNIIYVAATRSREKMVLICDPSKEKFKTINYPTLHKTCKVHGILDHKKTNVYKKINKGSNKKLYEVSELIKHRKTDDIIGLLNFITVEIINDGSDPLCYDNIIQFNGYYEDMKLYYGLIIPILAEYDIHLQTEACDIPDNYRKILLKTDPKLLNIYDDLIQNSNKNLKDWMKLIVLFTSILKNCHFYFHQIQNYDWVDEDFITTQVDRIKNTIPNKENGFFEYQELAELSSCDILAQFDYFDTNQIWEFKCQSCLSDENIIQSASYCSIYYLVYGISIPCYLFNTRSNKILKITVENPTQFIDLLTKHKL